MTHFKIQKNSSFTCALFFMQENYMLLMIEEEEEENYNIFCGLFVKRENFSFH